MLMLTAVEYVATVYNFAYTQSQLKKIGAKRPRIKNSKSFFDNIKVQCIILEFQHFYVRNVHTDFN